MRVHFLELPADEHRAILLDRLNPEITAHFGPERIEDANIVVGGRPDRSVVESRPNLRAVIVPFAGVPDTTRELMRDFPACKLYNLHHNAAATAEMAIALMMAVGRRLSLIDSGLRRGEWAGRTIPDSVGTRTEAMAFDGSTCLLIGYGEIGQRIAKVCLALGMKVEAIRHNPTNDGGEVRIRPMAELRDALSTADVVCIAAPLTPETQGLIGEEELKAMKPSAILVNIARGAIVDEEALFNALNLGAIAGAGLDVWWQYPSNDEPTKLPSKFDFASLDNVVMTPHVGGANAQTERRRMEGLAELLNRLHAGESVKSVDLAAGY